jgi:drug/metabolite transporter (DMT)-like permease
MFFWGVAFVSGRVLTQDYHPFAIAFLRFFLATIVLLFIVWKKNLPFFQLNRLQFIKVFFLGLSGIFTYNFFFFTGLQTVEAGRASVIIATNPAFTSFLSYVFLNEKFSRLKIFGLILAITGALVVISRGQLAQIFAGNFGFGEFCILMAVLSWATYTILGKKTLNHAKPLTPLVATTWATCIGTLLLTPFALIHNVDVMIKMAQVEDWLHIINLGIFSTCFGFLWYYEAVLKLGASKTSTFINLIPFFAIATGIIYLQEIPSLSLIVGGGITIFGVYLSNRK